MHSRLSCGIVSASMMIALACVAPISVAAVESVGGAEQIEYASPDYNAPTDSYANSWRYEDGIPNNAISTFAEEANTWSYSNGVWHCSNGTSVSGARAMGVDVSQWQGDINWAQAKASGVQFALIRAGYGGNISSQDDKTFLQNVRGCIDNNIPFGVYVYSYAVDASEARGEAEHVIRLLNQAGLNPYRLSYPVYLDLEEQAKTDRPCVKVDGQLRYLSNDDLASIASAFASRIQEAGYAPGVYANLKWWNNYLTSPVFSQWSRWVAQYNVTCDYKGSYDIWQRSSKASIPGIAGNVDINFSFADPLNVHPTQDTWGRIYGQDEFDTMKAIAKSGWSSSESAVLATNATYWDALTASALAGVHDAPILLTNGSKLSSQARSAISELGVRTVYVCGGPIAISSEVEAELKAMGVSVVRVAGSDQQDTARKIADKVQEKYKSDTCIIATDWKFQDALSISPYAYHTKSPIFLTNSGSNVLSDATLNSIKRAGFKKAVIVGGPIAVNSTVDGQLKSAGVGSVERIYGQTEYETSLAIANWEISHGMTVSNMAVATGTTFFDALSGSALCGKDNSVLVICSDYNRVCLTDFVAKHRGQVEKGRVFGGEIAVSRSTWNALLRSYFG